ncbi:hypothetical protein C8F04DRAFT_1198930 [Mycena alexandri]|uniref:Uncharacterized protein n=1 Tax=Mycena alexandri TaxID=1745969 RepID=A0AAD6S045_9AGAR|nr:hypothetical protein C8F04DRAFT_1198930 [Mycena alexandri]
MPKNATIPRETITTWQCDNFRRKSDNAGTRSSNISGTRIDCEVIRPLRVPLLPSGPPHNILAIFLVPPPYNGRLDFGEQRQNAKKHVKCHNQNIKWLMQWMLVFLVLLLAAPALLWLPFHRLTERGIWDPEETFHGMRNITAHAS